MKTLEARLLGSLTEVLAYARRKVGDPELAADLVQDSLLKALRTAPSLRDEDRVLPWFYRILNNTITDAYRRRRTARKHLDPFPEEGEPAAPDEEDEAALCQCLYPLLETMNPDYALLIRTLDLDGADPRATAERLGITRDNLKVRRHRARRQLRQRLEQTCGVCATHGCLDCTCRTP